MMTNLKEGRQDVIQVHLQLHPRINHKNITIMDNNNK